MNIIKDSIDELLKSDAATHRDYYVDDAGFTLRVVDRLPARPRVSSAMRVGILLVLTSLAAAFSALFAGGGDFLVDATMDIATGSLSTSALVYLAIVGILIVVSVTAASDS